MEISKYFKLLSQVDQATSIDDFRVLCEEFCHIASVPHYLLVVLDQVPLCTPEIKFLSNVPAEKIKSAVYNYNQTVKADISAKADFSVLVHYLMENQTPVRWKEAMAEKAFGDIDYQHLLGQFDALGLCNGFSIPLKLASGEVAIFNIAMECDTEEQDALNSALPLAHTFATYLFSRFVKVVSKEKINKLTPRELDCLFWACEGKTAWEISQIIDVSERTVLFHLNNSTKKLSACNRQHAVALATIKGIIKPDISRLRVASQFKVA
jgi:LuxR family transcriptional activator of bioluminescence operon